MKSVEIGRVDLSLVESAGFHTPMLEDLHIRTIVHQLLYGLLHGFSKLGVALLDSDTLLGHTFDVAQGFKWASPP